MSTIRLDLNQPYPLNESIKGRWLNCVLFSTFVFLFLYIFKPFNLGALTDNLFLLCIGYASVCFVLMALLNVGIFSAFPNYFSESKWTSKSELVWSLLNVLFIGFGNFLYSVFIGIANFSFYNLVWFETYTVVIGIFPITISVLFNQIRLSNKFEGESQKINPFVKKQVNEVKDNLTVKIWSENEKDELNMLAHEFLFAKSEDNYVEIYYLLNETHTRKLIRNTLKNIENQLPVNNDFFRCHKSYLVNLKNVNHISGNAQGYKLHIAGTNTLVSVSRSNNDLIKQYFTNRP
jgi:hypothetical protein